MAQKWEVFTEYGLLRALFAMGDWWRVFQQVL